MHLLVLTIFYSYNLSILSHDYIIASFPHLQGYIFTSTYVDQIMSYHRHNIVFLQGVIFTR